MKEKIKNKNGELVWCFINNNLSLVVEVVDSVVKLFYTLCSRNCRFLTKDSWHGVSNDPQSLNRYAYAGGDPVNLADPTGHYWVLIARDAVVAVKVGVRVVKSWKYARQVGNGVAKVGELHHIASNKSIKSGFIEAYEKIFIKAGMTLQHSTNKISLEGHKRGSYQ